MNNKLLELAKQKLSKQELGYFRMIYPQYLVMMLKGKPGTWKSAILKSIADKLNTKESPMVFIDLRLPTMDEVDLGAYPVVVVTDGKPIIKMGIPEWAAMTLDKSKNFLIVFEELNRTSASVRNAALGLLLERRIGPNFTFGDNVYMAATGNLGQGDGTDVEEFDTALKSRLITVHHDAQLHEWLENFAETLRDKDGNITRKGAIHSDIVEFLKAKPTSFYPDLKENEQNEVITNPRTWTALSEAIITNFGEDAKVGDYHDFVATKGIHYVGTRSHEFLKFMEEYKPVTFDDVLNGKVKNMATIKRDNRAEILRQFEIFDPGTISTKKDDPKYARLVEFLRSVDRDLLVGAISNFGTNRIIALDNKKATPRESQLYQDFKTEYDYIAKQEDEEANQQKAK